MASMSYHPSRFTLLYIFQLGSRGSFAVSDSQTRLSDMHTGHRSADSQNMAVARPVQTPVQQPAGVGPLPDPSQCLAHTTPPRH